MFIHQKENWTEFTWNRSEAEDAIRNVIKKQGKLLGMCEVLGLDMKYENANFLVTEVMKTSEIEGELLKEQDVRSSVARQLHIETAGLKKTPRNVDGVVEMHIDAVKGGILDEKRLLRWHSLLFPDGKSGISRIVSGKYREGEVSVVSGAIGKEKTHYVAPEPSRIPMEMKEFFDYAECNENPLIKAAIAHLRFVMIHPFEDGNGRIARAISDMFISIDDPSSMAYSISDRIFQERKTYYGLLEKIGKGNGEISEWMNWFFGCLERAIDDSINRMQSTIKKASFWNVHGLTLNERQKKIINLALDGFDGKLTSSKYAKIAKCSQDTAMRDINDLIDKNILKKGESGGRSTSYELVQR
jgi:Fic family protein